MTTTPQHVIFGTGAIGLATLDALLRRGESVRMVNRSGIARVPDDVEVVAGDAADRALPGLVDRLCNAVLLEQSVGEVAARMYCRPYATEDRDLWIVSDLTPGLDGAPIAVGPDHVLGISSASTSLQVRWVLSSSGNVS